MKTKICSGCKVDKPYSDYFKDNRRKVGIRCKCKDCCKKETIEWRHKNRSEYNNYVAEWRAKNPDRQHATEIKRHYGLSLDRYKEFLVAQDYKCRICGKMHDTSKQRARLYVDHDHSTGDVRGLLCHKCNSGIGQFNDSVELLKKAIDYLNSYKT